MPSSSRISGPWQTTVAPVSGMASPTLRFCDLQQRGVAARHELLHAVDVKHETHGEPAVAGYDACDPLLPGPVEHDTVDCGGFARGLGGDTVNCVIILDSRRDRGVALTTAAASRAKPGTRFAFASALVLEVAFYATRAAMVVGFAFGLPVGVCNVSAVVTLACDPLLLETRGC